MGNSNNPEYQGNELFLKMNGHNLYKYALKYVPQLIKATLDKAGLALNDIKKIIIHQANEKMDEAIVKRLFSLYNIKEVTCGIMPMIISWLGNSSVVTIPTLLDLIMKKKLNNHHIEKDDNIVFASVGAGMNINSIVYRMP
jgi:3-oxoacyl-[acyl-carrier-protein] synthase-3